MVDKIKGKLMPYYKKVVPYYDKFMAYEYKNLLYIAVFFVVIVLFWKKFVGLFKPLQTSVVEDKVISNVNGNYLSSKRITSDGHFVNGAGVKTVYTIGMARQNAEELASLLKTYKGSKWYSVVYSFFGLGAVSRIKVICNPNYPASYRKYVSDVYRDVYTDYRNLGTDVRNELIGFAGSSWWDNNLTKYFTY